MSMNIADGARIIDYVNQRSLDHLLWHQISSIWPSGPNSVVSFTLKSTPSCCKYKACVFVPPTKADEQLSENPQIDAILRQIEELDPYCPSKSSSSQTLEPLDQRSLSPASTSDSSGYSSRSSESCSRRSSSNESNTDMLMSPTISNSPSPPPLKRFQDFDNDEISEKAQGQWHYKTTERKVYGSGRFNRPAVLKRFPE